MQESVSMNARKCVHEQKPYPSQAFAHESSKVGGRGKRDRKDRGQEADGKKGSPTNKNTSEELKQGLPGHRMRLTKQGEKLAIR